MNLNSLVSTNILNLNEQKILQNYYYLVKKIKPLKSSEKYKLISQKNLTLKSKKVLIENYLPMVLTIVLKRHSKNILKEIQCGNQALIHYIQSNQFEPKDDFDYQIKFQIEKALRYRLQLNRKFASKTS